MLSLEKFDLPMKYAIQSFFVGIIVTFILHLMKDEPAAS